jgi:hypothetical protein
MRAQILQYFFCFQISPLKPASMLQFWIAPTYSLARTYDTKHGLFSPTCPSLALAMWASSGLAVEILCCSSAAAAAKSGR